MKYWLRKEILEQHGFKEKYDIRPLDEENWVLLEVVEEAACNPHNWVEVFTSFGYQIGCRKCKAVKG